MIYRNGRELRDLPLAEIEAALSRTEFDLSIEQILAVETFIHDIGGMRNARLAVDTLRELEVDGEMA